MLASSGKALPAGRKWLYEVKWDGYRALAVKNGDGVRLISRNAKDLTRDYPTLVTALEALPAKRAILDGEIVALDSSGRPSFQALQHRTSGFTVAYCAFDAIAIDGDFIMHCPLSERRRILAKLLRRTRVQFSEELRGNPTEIERAIREHGLEGVVAKQRDSVYRPGRRSHEWVKVKFSPHQEFVIAGYSPGNNTFESVLLGYYREGELKFAARLRAGFTPSTRRATFQRISKHERRGCPFSNLPNSTVAGRWGEGITAEDMKSLRWVRPLEVVQVAFVEWTREGLLRHPTFAGFRPDKRPRDVRREGRHASRGGSGLS
jgi:bifunctional non-homologous end joining protein LigD